MRDPCVANPTRLRGMLVKRSSNAGPEDRRNHEAYGGRLRLNRETDFRAGLDTLKPFFEAWDYQVRVCTPLVGEEGTYYSAQFAWGNHTVTLTHLFGLETVTYTVGAMSIEHEAYLDALTVRTGAAYPTSADDSIAGYHALLSDLETRMAPFFESPEREFMELAMTYGRRDARHVSRTDDGGVETAS